MWVRPRGPMVGFLESHVSKRRDMGHPRVFWGRMWATRLLRGLGRYDCPASRGTYQRAKAGGRAGDAIGATDPDSDNKIRSGNHAKNIEGITTSPTTAAEIIIRSLAAAAAAAPQFDLDPRHICRNRKCSVCREHLDVGNQRGHLKIGPNREQSRVRPRLKNANQREHHIVSKKTIYALDDLAAGDVGGVH